MELRETFNSAANIYDLSRPSYPDAVVDWILERTQISKESWLLEIGSGTGQATLKFAERGYKIQCIEMGEHLAEILREKGSTLDIKVDVSTFEAWESITRFKTPLIFSATAFHWIDSSVKYHKSYDLLEENGYLVLLWHVVPDSELEAVNKAYELLWALYPERADKQNNIEAIKDGRKQEIEACGLFTLVDYLDFRWHYKESREQLTNAFFSQSSFLALNKEQQQLLASKVINLYQEIASIVETEIHTTVYIARKL